MTKRIFIAINLPDEIKNKLADLQTQLAEFDLPIRWTKSKNIHLTLCFLGELGDSEVEKVKKITQRATFNVSPLTLYVKNLGVFPNFKNPQVVWIGVEDSENLINLQKELADKLREERFEIEDRKFSPHLTLGRTKKKIKDSKIIFEKIGEVNLGEFEVKSIEIIESKLTPEGPEYRSIENVKLTYQ